MDAVLILDILSIALIIGLSFFLFTFRTTGNSNTAWMLRLLVFAAIWRSLSFLIWAPANPELAIYRNLPAYIAYSFMLILYFSTKYGNKE